VVLLDVVEFVHDTLGVLRAAGEVASHLVVSYRPADGQAPPARRRLGYFNDFGADEIEALLRQAGWRVERAIDGAGVRLFDCRRG
jgi:hypothetical protein